MNWLEKMGVELPLLKWTEPRAVTRLDEQRQNWLSCQKFIAQFCKFGITIGLPVLIATKIWFPEGFVPAIIGNLVVVTFCCLLPIIAFLQVWMLSYAGVVCAINRKGLVKSNVLYEWENIVSYQFNDHPDLSNVRVLRIKVQDGPNEHEREFCFDPHETSESEIREWIEKFMASHDARGANQT